MQSEKLIQLLEEQVNQIVKQAEMLKNLDLESLNWKSNPESWCILECLEHLNLYGEYYLPIMEEKIKNTTFKNETEFKSGFLGNFFSKSMLPKGKLNKMNTFKDKNPLNAKLDSKVIDVFIQQQIKTLDLLNKAKKVSLNKVKINLSITRLIKLKLGDLFQFLTNHIIRHFLQIERIQNEKEKLKY